MSTKNVVKSAIFQNGKIYIKEENGNVSETDLNCIPIIMDNINMYIENHPDIFRVQDIIFQIIKEYFNVSRVTVRPKDPLYTFLMCSISNNEAYHERIIQKRKYCNAKSKNVRKKRSEVNCYMEYLSDKIIIEKKRKNIWRWLYGKCNWNI